MPNLTRAQRAFAGLGVSDTAVANALAWHRTNAARDLAKRLNPGRARMARASNHEAELESLFRGIRNDPGMKGRATGTVSGPRGGDRRFEPLAPSRAHRCRLLSHPWLFRTKRTSGDNGVNAVLGDAISHTGAGASGKPGAF